jgi:hypothetical protein
VVALAVGLLIGCSGDEVSAPATTTTVPEVVTDARVVVHQRPELDDVLLLGAPFGVEDRGVLVTVDLSTGEVTRAVHGGELWPPGFKEPTTDPDRPDAEAASRSPDGRHLAAFTRATGTRLTGVTISGDDGDRFHHLQSVDVVVGGRLVWSPDSDAVYLLASADGSADRVIGIPLVGSPQTVVRLDERGFTWLAVAPS